MAHLNRYPGSKQLPERDYFYGIIGTLAPDYLSNLIKHANRIRNRGDERDSADETINVSVEIYEKLNQEPFFSSKIILL